MTTLNFTINNKNYSVDCGAGQENQILSIVNMIDEKAKTLAKMFGEVDSETLLLMVCILVFGEFEKAKAKLANLEGDIKNLMKTMSIWKKSIPLSLIWQKKSRHCLLQFKMKLLLIYK